MCLKGKLNQKEEELNKLKLEFEEIKTKMEILKDKTNADKKREYLALRRKMVQTTFFKPVVKKEKVLDENIKIA